MDFYGVVSGAYSNHHDRLGEINSRISERNIPSAMLRPAFEVRPLSSKYATLPILETRPVSRVPLQSYEQFTTESVFNPGNAKAPWRGWAERVNVETHLRNQYFALQRNDRAVYVPNSNSDLYNVTVIARDVEQPNPYLFENGASDFSPMNPNPHNLGKLTFDNSTRFQLRTLDCTYDGFCTGKVVQLSNLPRIISRKKSWTKKGRKKNKDEWFRKSRKGLLVDARAIHNRTSSRSRTLIFRATSPGQPPVQMQKSI